MKLLPIDTIKIDRSFIQDIVHNRDDAAIVDAIIAMAHSLGLTVIAEGVETEEQLAFLRRRKCHEVQGYLFAKPLETSQLVSFLTDGHITANQLDQDIYVVSVPINEGTLEATEVMPPDRTPSSSVPVVVTENIGDISLEVVPAHPGDNLAAVLKRFQNEPQLQVLPVVDNGHTVGIINRSTFLEEHIIGMNGYAFHINHSKKMRDLMSPVILELEAAEGIRKAAQIIQLQKVETRIDNICVTRNGMYYGIVDVNRFISAITEINLTLAKGANPLTGLPGNESIQREINERIASGEGFDIAYIDIDNFKPYNDYYGFQLGDVVIKTIGEIIAEVAESADAAFKCFCGHIGGDDYIIITAAHHAEFISLQVIRAVENQLRFFHGEEDYAMGHYYAMNRKGEQETFGLISLSIGIVNTRLTPVTSYPQLASISTEVKKAAKKMPGSSVVINRRTTETGSFLTPLSLDYETDLSAQTVLA